MQKGFALIPLLLILALFIGVGAATFYLKDKYIQKSSSSVPGPSINSQINNSVSEVKKENTFKNEDLGFEFTIPEGMIVKEETEAEFHERSNGNIRKNFTGYVRYAPAEFISSVYVLDKIDDFENAPLSIWVSDNPRNLEARDFYKDYWYYPYVWGEFGSAEKNKIAPKEKEIIDRLTTLSALAPKSPGSPKFIYLNRDEKMFLFRIVGDSNILDSFKFLE